jgi:pimeloyl-ACP methyl ester carboxylesterase
VRGASDGLFPAPYLDAWRAAVAGARALTFEGAGNLPMVEAEDAFIEAVESFLA